MGILSFIKDAGEKLFGAVSAPAQATPAAAPVDVCRAQQEGRRRHCGLHPRAGLSADNMEVSV